MILTKMMLPISKYPIKSPTTMTPTCVIVHNTANNASAMAEASYMIRNNNYVSFHYAVDDYRVVQCIEENRVSYNCGNREGNYTGISVEICYSTGPIGKFKLAEINGAKLIAMILHRRGWGINRVKKHQDFKIYNKNGTHYYKYCPHKTLDLGWKRFLDMVQQELNNLKMPTQEEKQKAIETEFINAKISLEAELKNVSSLAVLDKKYQRYKNVLAQKLVKKVDVPSATTKKFNIGDKVAVSITATHYATGSAIAGWVKGSKFTIEQIKNDRALLQPINSWVYLKDLR